MKPRSAFRLIALLPALVLGEPLLAELSQEPILRIETGRHLAPITRISSDAEGRWAVTASEDKTARLWDLRSGKEITVLRPPIGSESVGALYAAAMSPDGKQVALGGNSAFDDRTNALYLFDRGTGTLPPKRTLSGIEAPITQLAWTADSQMLALGLRQEGLRVFRRDLGFVGTDPEYNEAIYGAAFSRNGQLAVVSLDGYLRLYSFGKKGMERLARIQIPGKPYTVAWSPDGSQLAIGLQDAPSALILSAGSLEILHRADAGGAGNLGRVAWSPDGQMLYAAGSVVRDGRFAIFAFADGGRGTPRPIGSFANTVTALTGNSNGLLASSAEPAWAFFDWSGNTHLGTGTANADYRDAGTSFRISRNAAKVAFPMRQGGNDAQLFDLLRGEVRTAPPPSDTVEAQVPRSLRDWHNALRPNWDGKPLALRPGETSRSAALAPDGQRLVLGTDWYLRAFTVNGAQAWEKRVAGAAWAVNISGDGRWVVAALGDGSIRWHRLSDGAEQLALFPHGDRERWIVWSPSGYYDASMGGEGLVGWHVNRAANQAADFFSAGRFRERFNMPGVIQKILDSGDEQEAVRAYRREQAVLETAMAPAPAVSPQPAPPAPAAIPLATAPIAQALPPVIELQTERGIETGENLVPVRYVVRTPADAPVKEVKFRVNGKLERSVKTRSMRAAEGSVFEAMVPVPPKDSEIVMIAENKHAKSDPVSITVRRIQRTAAKTQYVEKYDTLYMLIIAVNKYPGENALKLPVKDANDFRRQMQRIANPPPDKQRLYERSSLRILIDEEATLEKVRDGLKWLRDSVKEKDAGVVFLAGHGNSQDRSYFFVPYRSDSIGKRDDWLPGSEIVQTLQSLPGRAMFFLDTCHAGAFANMANVAGTVNQVDEERGVIIFASATAKELAQETDEWGNGAFTKALIEGFRGGAEDPRDNLVYPTTLKRYVTRRVRELTDNQQRPYVSDQGVDDPIAAVVE